MSQKSVPMSQNPVGSGIDDVWETLDSVGFATGSALAVAATVLIVLMTQISERAE